MTTEMKTVELPLRLAIPEESGDGVEWRLTSCEVCEARGADCALEALVRSLSPERGVHKASIDRKTGTMTLEVDPDLFSLDQVKAVAEDVGLKVENSVQHCILDLPTAGRAEVARSVERKLLAIPGVAGATVNPAARTITIEYLEGSEVGPQLLESKLQEWGYAIRDINLPPDWWERHRLTLYTLVAGVGLGLAWLLSAIGVPAWLYAPLAIVAYLAGGGFAARNGLRALRGGEIDIDILMVTAALGAAIIGEWVEGGILLFLFALSNALEHYAMDRTRRAIRSLMDLRPERALVRRDGGESTVETSDLRLGDVVIVRPGERIPADGVTVEGQSSVDQAPITGESIPVPKAIGDDVFAGTINGSGLLEIEVTKRAQETTLARIIQLVEEARSERAPTQRRLDYFEQRYAVAVLVGAALAILLPPLFLGWSWNDSFYRSMTLLVVASPCALVISTPASILSAIAAGARSGSLFKGGAHVEQLARIRVVAFDKTGTLTVGRPQVTDVLALGDCSADDLLRVTAAVENRSEHPLARAIVMEAEQRELTIEDARELKSTPGRGIEARMNEEWYVVGTLGFVREKLGSVKPETVRQVRELEEKGKTVIAVSSRRRSGDYRLLGLIAVSDTVRPEAKASLESLRQLGIEKLVMLTGDNSRAARAIGDQVGVDEVFSELLPEEKVDVVERLLQEHGEVAMVGDGVNDAPALARASLGVAMGAGGTDVALETADVVLMASDLTKLPDAIGLSRKSMRIVRQNLAFSVAVIALLIVSTLLNLIRLPLGVVGHEGSTVLVVLNGLRLLGRSPKPA